MCVGLRLSGHFFGGIDITHSPCHEYLCVRLPALVCAFLLFVCSLCKVCLYELLAGSERILTVRYEECIGLPEERRNLRSLWAWWGGSHACSLTHAAPVILIESNCFTHRNKDLSVRCNIWHQSSRRIQQGDGYVVDSMHHTQFTLSCKGRAAHVCCQWPLIPLPICPPTSPLTV